MLIINQGVGRISLVKDTGQHEVWFSITTNTRATQPTSDHHTYGRLEHRLGIALVQMKTSGYWSENEKTGSINVRELRTILFALQLQNIVNRRHAWRNRVKATRSFSWTKCSLFKSDK